MRNQRGIALVITLMVMAVLQIMAMAFLGSTIREVKMGKNYQDHARAFYHADGGLQVARYQLKTIANWTALKGNTFPCLIGTCQYTVLDVSADDKTIIVEATATVNLSRSTVRAAFRRFPIPVPAGALWSLGQPGSVAFNGNAFEVDGNNWRLDEVQDNTACGAEPVPKFGIAVKTQAAQTLVKAGLTATQQDNVIGSFPNPPWAPPSGIPSIGVDDTWAMDDVKALADNLAGLSGTIKYTGANTVNTPLGTDAAPVVVVSDGGDFQLQATTGAGILIVKNGNLVLQGNTRWDGLIIVVGPTASVVMQGGGNKAVYGSAIIVKDDVTAAEIATGGGNFKLRYSCAGMAVANVAASGASAQQLWWTEVR